jgi:multidrug efflux pump subunit AcrB
MTFIAFLLLGGVAAGFLPVSLMPDVDIPEITVKVERPGVSVRELENTIVRPLRQSLMQVAHLDHISSESREGTSLIRLRFQYGTDISYAFIDVNEKVDGVMRDLPRDVERPAIIKASATDLPVFYINVQTKDDSVGITRFMELCEFTAAVLKKRLEQLPQVALVDMTGQLWPELYILPDAQRMRSLGLNQSLIQSVLKENNVTLGSLQVIDGQYQYNIRFSNALRDVEDVQNLYLKSNGRLLQLKDIAQIGIRPQKQEGMFLQRNKPALSMAVIKQSDARMEELKGEVDGLLEVFERDFPEVQLTVTRDQTSILSFAIANLKQSLLLGGFLAFLILFFFLKDTRSPWLIGFSIPVSLIISLLLFHLLQLSLNIISLSGLILGIGMMIDNSIIVIDNITQRIERGDTLAQACIQGTNEIIRPLISSVLTTCAVFLPLIFISGISGALFYDQAVAVTIGLFVSLLVSITLLPTLYRLFWLRAERKGNLLKDRTSGWINKIQLFQSEQIYERGWKWVFANRSWFILVFLFLVIVGGWMAWQMPKERFPAFRQKELVMHIDWNEHIHLTENKKRVMDLLEAFEKQSTLTNAFVGTQQFVLHKDQELSPTEAVVYFTFNDPGAVSEAENQLRVSMQNYPGAKISFRFPETIFERLFEDREAPFVAQVSSQKENGVPGIEEMDRVWTTLQKHFPQYKLEPFVREECLELRVLPERLQLYEVDQQYLYSKLKAALSEYQVGVLRSRSLYVPIVISDRERSINAILRELKINNQKGREIPVNQLVVMKKVENYKVIHGGKDGEYVPIPFHGVDYVSPAGLAQSIKQLFAPSSGVIMNFTGKLFSSRLLLKELLIVMAIALVLLYFILAAQFESLTQPLIVLLEVPMDIAGALGLLWLFGGTINLMAMIGIIVMSGIIINDSILKIDTINQLRRCGMGLMEAIETGGKRRLKPILMTSLTTVLALTPFLLAHDMGSELQQPLALTVIGGMVIGTLVSLYFIPLCYYYLCRKSL